MTQCFKNSLPIKVGLIMAAFTFLNVGNAAANPHADLNKDGQLTSAEFMAAAKKRFAKSDQNKDNKLSVDEMEASKKIRHRARKDQKFDRLDANKDGFITRDEFDVAQANLSDIPILHRRARHLKRSKGRGPDVLKETRNEKRKAMKRHKKRFGEHGMNMDANGDGYVTVSEYERMAKSMFLHLDVNGDGVLTKARVGSVENSNLCEAENEKSALNLTKTTSIHVRLHLRFSQLRTLGDQV